ncbi:DUF6288 domain-containing protein [Planctomycetota bacterium]
MSKIVINTFPISSIASFVVTTLLAYSTASAINWKEQEGSPWNRKTNTGPDAAVNGFYINLGITGARAKLTEKYPQYLVIAYVFKGTPAHGRLAVGDLIVGANGRPFTVAHTNGYGMGKFGGEGPLMAFGNALGESQIAGGKWNGKLALHVKRGQKKLKVTLNVGTKYGQYSDTYPHHCKKAELIRKELYAYIASRQNGNGSFPGGNHVGTFAALALLASGNSRYMPNARRFAQHIARATDAELSDRLGGMQVWKYTFAGIYLAEYYLATREKWGLKELEEVRDWLIGSQFIYPKSQLRSDRAETEKKGHVEKFVGGWGHSRHYQGYGPMSCTTSQAAMALALMARCGIEIDRKRLDMAYDFLASGTNRIGYVWYNSVNAGNGWADMGRTGSTVLANYLAPYRDKKYWARAMLSAKCIGDHPKSFPDTHGCPPMGMVWAALAARIDTRAFRNLMTYHKWWFNLAQCPDRTFVAQPNRDAGGSYTSAPRLFMSSVVALIFSIENQRLHITGRSGGPVGYDPSLEKGRALLKAGKYAEAHRALIGLATAKKQTENSRSAARILREIAKLGADRLSEIKTQASTDPTASMAALEKMQADFRGFRVARAAADLHAKLKAQGPAPKSTDAPSKGKQSDPKAALWLKIARDSMADGRTTSARRYLRMILEERPHSGEAEKARQLLQKLK